MSKYENCTKNFFRNNFFILQQHFFKHTVISLLISWSVVQSPKFNKKNIIKCLLFYVVFGIIYTALNFYIFNNEVIVCNMRL